MVETLTKSGRSEGISYNELLESDTHPVRDILKQEGKLDEGPTRVPVEQYYSREAHDREVEKLWKRVWQLTCHEDDIPNIGDTHVYDIAHLSYIIIRTGNDTIQAFPNACLHRGRALLDGDRKGMGAIRCPFHGWSWELDGKLKEIPCHWDFPGVDSKSHSLSPVKTGRWGGFIFINPDPSAESLESFLGDIDKHFTLLPFERRYKAVHVAKRVPCNWKVAQEAFMESYHVVATHPTLLSTLGDANSKYDVFGNYSRAISPNGVPSPHLHTETAGDTYDEGTLFTRHRHALTGHLYERIDEDRVKLTLPNGKTGVFNSTGRHISGEARYADPHICNWFGGKLTESMGADQTSPPAASIFEYRAREARLKREAMRPVLGDKVDEVSDAEFVDSLYFSVFPNISPWGSFNPIFYRFRPDGDNPEQCIHEVMLMLPVPEGEPRPLPAEVHWLDIDDDYTEAPELGMLCKVFNQDQLNLASVQKGLHSHPKGEVVFAQYQETKIRHFHKLLQEWLERD